jgi:hypothetical protein
VKFPLLSLTMLVAACVAQTSAPLPIANGKYVFRHKFAEQPTIQSFTLIAEISGHRIRLINQSDSDVFPKGVIAKGLLMWRAKSQQWIIGQQESDRAAEEVGGCSDGPEVVDLQQKIYWTC